MVPYLKIRDRSYFSFGFIGFPQTEQWIGDIGVNNGHIRPSNPISGSVWTIFSFSTSFDSALLIGILPFAIYTNITLKCIKSFVLYALVRMIDYQKILKSLTNCETWQPPVTPVFPVTSTPPQTHSPDNTSNIRHQADCAQAHDPSQQVWSQAHPSAP